MIFGAPSRRYYPIVNNEPASTNSKAKSPSNAKTVAAEVRTEKVAELPPVVISTVNKKDSSPSSSEGTAKSTPISIKGEISPATTATTTTPIGGGNSSKVTFHNKYELKEEVGVGSTSKCYKCCRKSDGKEFACKVIDKRQVEMKFSGLLDQFNIEIKVLRALNHPNIIHLEDTFETNERIYMVMELMNGGELFDYVVDKGTLSEEEAASIVRKIISAVQHMHRLNIIHRDLKPENLLLTSRDGQPEVKLIDFGLAKVMEEEVASSFLGTKGYLAPEMLQRHSYDKAIDMWAVGVIVFVLLCGCLPFDDDSSRISSESAARKKFALRFPKWASGLSASAKDLLHNLLEIDPKRRFTADQAMNHPWVIGKTVQMDNYLQSPCILGERRRELRSPLASASIQDIYNNVTQHGSIYAASVGRPSVMTSAIAGGGRAPPNVTVTYYGRAAAPDPNFGYGSTAQQGATRTRKNSF